MMVKVVLLQAQDGRSAVGCVAVDQEGCEAWLVRQGYAEGVREWSKRYSDPRFAELQTATATIHTKPLIEAGGF